LRLAKQLTDWYGELPTQAALARFIDDGLLARHIRKAGREYAERRTRIANALQRDFSEWLELVPSAAGLHLTARVRAKVRARFDLETILARAAANGVNLTTLARYYTEPSITSPAGLLIGYGAIATQKVDEGMRRLAAEVIRTHDADRARVARELHESVAQDLAAQMLQLGAVALEMPTPELRDRVLAIRTMAHDTMHSLRALSQTVYPEILDSLGLGPALSQLVRTAREHCAVTIDLAVDLGASSIPAAPAAVLYHVAQEALRNACVHAGAQRITISLTADSRMAILTVADDGDGFEVATAESPAPGFGIFSMRERLALANGRLEVFSMPGRGTRVVAIIPLSTLEEL